MDFLKRRKGSQVPRRRIRQFDESERQVIPQYTTFRRNRTLTGSASSSVVAAANESGADIKSPRVHAHELTRKRRHLGALLGALLLCAGALLVLILQFSASVVVRASDISSRITPSDYEISIQEYLRSRPAERLRFLLNREQLLQYVQAASPEVEAITQMRTSGFGQTTFVLKMRTPLAGWSINDKHQYVDGTGVVFEKNFYTSPPVQIIDKSGLEVRDSSRVASNRFLGFVGRVVAMAKEFSFTVSEVAIPKGATRQVQVKMKGVTYPIKFSIDRPVGEQVEDMSRAIQWMGRKGITPQYLDVRVENRAFYR